MKTSKQIVKKWTADAVRDLRKTYEEKGLKASGAYGRSLEPFAKYKRGGVRLGVLGSPHAQYMQEGTTPHADKSPAHVRTMYGIIKQWIEDKGLKELEGAAWPIAYKIVHHGTKVPNKHNDGRFISDVITEKRTRGLIDELGRGLAAGIQRDLIQLLKN